MRGRHILQDVQSILCKICQHRRSDEAGANCWPEAPKESLKRAVTTHVNGDREGKSDRDVNKSSSRNGKARWSSTRPELAGANRNDITDARVSRSFPRSLFQSDQQLIRPTAGSRCSSCSFLPLCSAPGEENLLPCFRSPSPIPCAYQDRLSPPFRGHGSAFGARIVGVLSILLLSERQVIAKQCTLACAIVESLEYVSLQTVSLLVAFQKSIHCAA